MLFLLAISLGLTEDAECIELTQYATKTLFSLITSSLFCLTSVRISECDTKANCKEGRSFDDDARTVGACQNRFSWYIDENSCNACVARLSKHLKF